MSIEDVVTELLLRWEDDPALSPEDLCRPYRDHPEHAALLEAVRREMGALRAADAFLDTSQGDGSEPGPGVREPLPEVSPAGAVPRPRYRPVAFHAKGGLGEVYRAEDEELHREVALKRIKEDHRGDAEQRRSFLREAEITAKLEHPGVVPVHGLQLDDGGEPCYAMRFIRGESLDAAIKQFHEADRQPGRNPGERSLALRQLLNRFVAVCNTVAYAHSRGVLHRDLKPGNIMLGAYGETLVVDWGLAKPFERTEAERATGEQTLQPPSAGAAAGTLPGVPKGTPAYISPEQADGRWDELSPATDIFSLGATLYALVVGQPPFQGRTAQEALQRARRGEFPLPRQVRRDVPRALEAVCLKAMARKPEDRYATALELAADVERWLADEPVGAWREPLPARLGRWARRHKPQVAGAAAVLLTALVLGGFSFGWWEWERSVTAQAAMPDIQNVEEVLQGLQDPAEARHALDRVDARLAAGGPANLRERIQRLRQDMAFVEDLEEARLKAATVVGGGLDFPGADRAYAKALAQHDLDVTALAPEEAARRIQALVISTRVALALDNWAYVKERLPGGTGEPLRAIARLADDDPWRQKLRDPAVRKDPAALEGLAQAKEVLVQAPASVVLLSYAMEQQKRSAAAERLLRQAQTRHPDDFWLNIDLANLLYHNIDLASLLYGRKPEELAEAVGYNRAAVACQPRTGMAHNNLGVTLYAQGKRDEAITEYRQAIQLDPKNALAHNNLGSALRDQSKLDGDQGKLDEAVAEYRRAIALGWKNARAHSNLGSALRDQGKLDEAVAEYRRAIALDANNALDHSNLGLALCDQRKLDEAVAECRRAIALDPTEARAHIGLGLGLWQQGQREQGIAEYRQAIALNANYAQAHFYLGNALSDQGKRDEAIAEYRQVTALDPKCAPAHGNLGHALLQQGRFAEAVSSTRRCLELLSPGDPKRAVVSPLLQQAERLLTLERKLPTVLAGEVKLATSAEHLEYAQLCNLKKLNAASARLYAEAFAGDAKPADDVKAGHRYNAACAAALAACGKGEDVAQLDDRERTRLRQQALFWLRADLTAWGKALNGQPDKARAAVQQQMQHWQHDSDLAGVRDQEALAKLPAAERQQWHQLWDDVEALRQRAAGVK